MFDGGRAPLSLNIIALMIAASVSPAAAKSGVEDSQYFRNKTITLIVGYPPGGANDIYAWLVARFLGSHVPGTSKIILQHMPGAGSATATAHIYNIAPKDGTILGLLAPTLPLEERLGIGKRYKSLEFSWIGRIAQSPNATFVWHTSKSHSIQDAFEQPIILGGTGASATIAIYPKILNAVVGTKFDVVMGYQGSAAAMLAMERGEIEGHSSTLDSLISLHADWLLTSKVRILVQYSTKRSAELPDVPTALELAKTKDAFNVLRLVLAAGDIGKAILSPPALEPQKLSIVRAAFDEKVANEQFLNTADEQHLKVDPISGAKIEDVVRSVMTSPDDVVERVRQIYPTP